MSDSSVPNLRGSNFDMMIGFVKPFVAVALFVGSLVWMAATFATKDAITQMREEAWAARLQQAHMLDAIDHLTSAVNQVQATQNTQAAAAAAAVVRKR